MNTSIRLLVSLAFITSLGFALQSSGKPNRIKGAEVCAQFSAAVVTRVLGEGMTRSESRHAPLCSWSRPLPDAKERSAAYQKEMSAWTQAKLRAMQTKSESPPMPKPPLTAMSVSVSWRGDAASAKDAQERLASAKRTITEGITVSATGSAKDGFKTKTNIGGREVDEGKQREAEQEANAVVKEVVGDAVKGAPDAATNREVSMTKTIQADVVDVEGVGDGAFWNPKHRALTVVKGKRVFTVTVEVPDRDVRALAIELARGWM